MATTTVNLNLPTDSTPTESSNNLVTSGGVYDALSYPQKNFQQVAENSVNYPFSMYRKVSSTNLYALFHDGVKGSFYSLLKDTLDDYWKISSCGYVDIVNTSIELYRINATLTGTFITSSKPSTYTTTIGDTITATVFGKKIQVRTYTDNRGGVWRFTLDNNPNKTIDISTYSSGTGNVYQTLFDNLEETYHSIKGEFIGADPLNPPSGGTARGWIMWDDTSTVSNSFYMYKNRVQTTNQVNILHQTSNKEFALLCKLSSGSSIREWIPDHGTGTAFGTVEILIDGVNFTTLSSGTEYFDMNQITISQEILGRNNSDAIDLVSIKDFKTIKNNKITSQSSITFLQETNVEGYVNMIPVSVGDFGTQLVDSRMNAYDLSITDGSQTIFPFKENLESICVIDDSSDFFCGVYFNGNLDTFLKNRTPYKTFLNGMTSRFWVEHRDAIINKLYPQTYNEIDIPAGFIHQTTMSISIGRIDNVFDMIKKPIVTN